MRRNVEARRPPAQRRRARHPPGCLGDCCQLRLGNAFGPKVDTLLRVQTAYEIAEARDREGDIKVKRYVPKERPATAPLSQ